MSLLGRKKPTTEEPELVDVDEAVDSDGRRTTAPKGRPTPKRDSSKRRGPIAPAPMTSAEARRRRKEVKGPKLSKEERREARTAQRKVTSSRREKMMSGDEAFLLPRDKGPVKRYVRDVVDSRRNVLGLFMPLAFGLVFIMLAVPTPQMNALASIVMLALVSVMIVDAVILGRKVNRLVDEKFPKHTETGWRLGFYSASRASQLRRMRAPRPQVKRGEPVA